MSLLLHLFIDSFQPSILCSMLMQVITTFSCFEKKELVRYFFYILDSRRTGLIEKVNITCDKITQRYGVSLTVVPISD